MINGHIFILGREFNGPCKEVFSTPSMNVPAQSEWDRKRVFKDTFKRLPTNLFTADEWEKVQEECKYEKSKWTRPFVTSSQVYKLKGLLKGTVIGPVDKNIGESTVVCPVLYHQASLSLRDQGKISLSA